jgi:adenosine kinase
MTAHTAAAHTLGVPVAADPSQQLARLDTAAARALVDGARFLFTNEYEAGLLAKRTGWPPDEIRARVGVWLTTLGGDGVRITTSDGARTTVPAVPTAAAADPTGVGDAFRAGFLAGVAWRWPYDRAARLGCALATVVLESVGPQEYELSAAELLPRIERAYGAGEARAMAARLTGAAV